MLFLCCLTENSASYTGNRPWAKAEKGVWKGRSHPEGAQGAEGKRESFSEVPGGQRKDREKRAEQVRGEIIRYF